jgi:digeranylgeranylglycerophospholipid reductase
MSFCLRADVIVVGLGPAGACAAAAAARAGLRVIGIDRKKVAGLPVQCAEFVPGPLHAHIANLAASTWQAISAMTTMIEMDDCHHTPDFRGAIIDRARFDQMLVADARDAGVHIILGAAVVSIGAEGLRLCDGNIIDAGIVIGADGPRSLIGQAIGEMNHELVETRQITVPLRRRQDATDIFLSGDYRGGYAWLFPRGDVANLGLGVVPSERHRLKPLLLQLHARLVGEDRTGRESLALTGGAIPVGGMLHPVGGMHGRDVLLAGDAAGLTNPVTGAGIAAAVLSGEMAGEAAAALFRGEAGAMVTYVEELREVFGASLARAVLRRRDLLRAYANDELPSREAIRQGWIAFPEYWSQLALEMSPEERRPA